MKKLNKETIDKIFNNELQNNKPHQANILIALYKVAFPNWKQIKSLNGYPAVSEKTNKYLFEQFIKFDKQIHPKVLNGGLWLNKGFSTDQTLVDWVIRECEAIYKQKVEVN